MAEHQLPKLNTRVRFPSPAPASAQSPLDSVSGGRLRLLPKTASVPLRLLSKSRPLCWVAILFLYRQSRGTFIPLRLFFLSNPKPRLRICFFPSRRGTVGGGLRARCPILLSQNGAFIRRALARAVNFLPAVPKYSKRAVSTAAACFLAGGSKTPTLPGSARRYHARMAAGRRTRARPA